ncbi:MAG: 4Fe-4S dicluster domain-containing protein [Anaerolineaceae bacterium]|nr:4Fe-4S dicluster domain-containing protein [Anaerolineaceae bacterium]
MATRVDPSLMHELKDYGAAEIEKCFNCGNCTAICPLAGDDYPFPRGIIRYIQLGLKDKMVHSLDPWFCYYCGDCSETCPKAAEPGETMMAARRWLTAQYDWTGLSKKLYTSKGWSIGALIVGALIVILLALGLHGPLVTQGVELNTFADVHMMHTADLILAGVLGFFLLSNLFRMYRFTFPPGDKSLQPPLSIFITEAWQLVLHILTQKRFAECEGKKRWISHMILVFGYGTMFILIVLFLTWFQTDEIYPIFHPQRLIGYAAALAIIYGAGDALIGRITKRHQMHRYSHISDWLFPILLILLSVSGLLISAFRISGLPLFTYYTYVGHLVVMMMLYICIGPMGKWAHLLYRPFAIYFQAVKEKALEHNKTIAQAPAPAS